MPTILQDTPSKDTEEKKVDYSYPKSKISDMNNQPIVIAEPAHQMVSYLSYPFSLLARN